MTGDPIYFYTPRDKYGEFSNFARFGVEMEGQWWKTVEHYFQSRKFHDRDYREKIRAAATPKEAAALGRSRRMAIREDWEQVKDGIMKAAVLKKFQTHANLRAMLLSTGEREIVENSPVDDYWGCGRDGSGKNRLGRILVEVREELRRASRPGSAID